MPSRIILAEAAASQGAPLGAWPCGEPDIRAIIDRERPKPQCSCGISALRVVIHLEELFRGVWDACDRTPN